jgi:AsmA protein
MGKKRLVIIVAAIGVLLVLLIAAPYLINVNNYRPTIEAALGSSLGRQAQIGHLRLSLLSRTLTAEDISISDDVAFGHSPFLRAKSLAVGVEVLPLVFSHTLHVRSLTLVEPELSLLRAAPGKWNFSSLGPKEKSGESASGLQGFSVQKLAITNGRISVGRWPSGAGQQSYDNVKLAAKDISTTSAFPLAMELRTSGAGRVKLVGTAGPIDPNSTMDHVVVHLKFNGQQIPGEGVQGLLQILGVSLPPGSSLRGGVLNADLASDGPLERLVTTGDVSVSNVSFSGFNLASKLGAMAALGGVAGGSDTVIRSMSSKIRVAVEGIRLDDLNISIPSMGTLTGAGIIGTDNGLKFRMVATLHAGSGPLGGIQAVASLGQSNSGFPFRIQGTASNPVFVPDVGGSMGKMVTMPSKGLGQIFSGLTGQKQKKH